MKAVWLSMLAILLIGQATADSTDSEIVDQVCTQCSVWCGGDSPDNNGKEEVSEPKQEEEVSEPEQEENENVTLSEPEGPSSCREFVRETAKTQNKTGGVIDIVVPEVGIKEVYCDVYNDPEDWIVFQRRMDGSVDFNRKWDDYVKGFGNARGEYWLGLETLYQMTKIGAHMMRVDMIAWDGTPYFVLYSAFYIGPASEGYRIGVNGFFGNTTDAFGAEHESRPFSTEDRDNDLWDGDSCAKTRGGGWWFGKCGWSNLNGEYGAKVDGGVVWFHQQFPVRDLRLKFVEMKFRMLYL